MVLIGIIGLVAAIAVPSFNGYLRGNEIGTTADRMAADMALARSLAVSQGRVMQFEVDAAGYRVTEPISARTISDRTFDGPIGIQADAVVNFYPWGAADSVTLILDNGNQQWRVQVLPTGLAEVQSCTP